MAHDSRLEAGDQPASVRIIADDLPPGLAARHHVVDRALKFDPQLPWHRERQILNRPTAKPKTKADSAKRLRLTPRSALWVGGLIEQIQPDRIDAFL